MKPVKYLQAVAALVFLTFAEGLAADTLQAVSQIEAVTVFGQQARIRRAADVNLKPGVNSVRIGGLPAGILSGTVRAGVAEGAASVIRLSESSHTENASINKRAAALEAAIDSLTYFHRDRISGLITVLKQQQELLELASESGSNSMTSQVRDNAFDVKSWQSAYGFLGESLTTLNDSLRVLNHLKQIYESSITLHKGQLNELNAKRPTVVREVTIDLEAPAGGAVGLYLEYLIGGANWRPIYDFHLVSGEEVEIRYYGEITQSTGEDWSEVSLTLSTSKPSLASTPGDFRPRFVSAFDMSFLQGRQNIRQITAESVKNMPASVGQVAEFGEIHVRGGRGNGVTHVIDGVPIEVLPGGFDAEYGGSAYGISPFTVAASNNFATSFAVKYPQTILTGSESVRAPIGTFRTECNLKLLARPSNLQAAFRFAEMSNQEEIPFLPGVVHLFAYNDYIGRASLSEPVFSNQEFEVPFGIDELVEIKREVAFEERDNKGDEWKMKQQITIKITNHDKSMRRLRVEEALPASRDKQIKVEINNIKPSPVDKNLTGKAVWELEIPAGETVTISFGYTLKYPAEFSLQGL